MKSILAAAAALLGAAILLSGCGKADDSSTLIVATEATFPPYEFRDKGEIVGFDIDIVRLVAEKLGRKMKVEDTKFDSIIAHVVTGKAHVGASGITVTEERAKKVLFTIPYETAAQRIIVPKGSKIVGKEDLKNNVRIGCQAGTTAYDYIRQNIIPDKNSPLIQQYDNGCLAVEALKAGKLDAVVLDEGPAATLVSQNMDSLILLDVPLTKEEYAFALNRKDLELCKAFNEVILELRKTGKLRELKDKNQKIADSQEK